MNNELKNILLTILIIGSLISISNSTFAETTVIWAGQGGDTTPPITMADIAIAEQPTSILPIATNMVDNITMANGGAEETIIFTGADKDYGDSGLTKSQAISMTVEEGATYILQRYYPKIQAVTTAGRAFVSLWRQILKEEFPEVLGSATGYRSWMFSAGVDGEVKYWMVSLLMDRYDEYGRYFMNENQTGTIKCYTFAEARAAVKKCDDILRSKGIY